MSFAVSGGVVGPLWGRSRGWINRGCSLEFVPPERHVWIFALGLGIWPVPQASEQ